MLAHSVAVAYSLVTGLADAPSPAPYAPPRLVAAERTVAVRGGGYFPVLARLADGSLGAVVRGGAGHIGRGGRLDFIRSTDDGRTWSAPVVVADSPWDDRNPALGQMPDGTIVIAYAEVRSYRDDGAFDLAAGPYLPRMTRSVDGGLHWSTPEPFEVPFQNPSPYGRIAILRDGTALMSVYEFPSNQVGVLRSYDYGRTWLDYTGLPGHDETQVIELLDSRLLAFTRIEEEGDHGLLLSESADAGRNWTIVRRLLRAGQWPFDATLLASGSLLLSFGCRIGPYGAGVLLSPDGGETWDESQQILIGWDSLSTDTGYPSTVQLDDGTIVTMYYAAGTEESPDEQAIVVRYSERQLWEALEQHPRLTQVRLRENTGEAEALVVPRA